MHHEHVFLGLCSPVRLLLHMHTSLQRFAAITAVTLSITEIPCLQHDHHQMNCQASNSQLLTNVDQVRARRVRKLELGRSDSGRHINKAEVWYWTVITTHAARRQLYHSGVRCINEHKIVVWLSTAMPISHKDR